MKHKRLPKWFHGSLPSGKGLSETNEIVRKFQLHTVCEEAKCPNRLECFSKRTATFLALGKTCTRACSFCDIGFSKTPQPPDPQEPKRIALSAKKLGLSHIVVTMVARDDLLDEGANHIAAIIQEVKKECERSSIEVLTSDFSGRKGLIDIVLDAKPDVFNHNIETVRSLSPRIRHKAMYDRTLSVLSYVNEQRRVPLTKSGLMVGLGEREEEVEETISDLQRIGCDMITIGQYLQPNQKKVSLKEFVHPDTFKRYEAYGHKVGVKQMYCGPFVRSSYHAGTLKTHLLGEKDVSS